MNIFIKDNVQLTLTGDICFTGYSSHQEPKQRKTTRQVLAAPLPVYGSTLFLLRWSQQKQLAKSVQSAPSARCQKVIDSCYAELLCSQKLWNEKDADED